MSNRTGRKLATLDRFEFSTYKIEELYIYDIFLYIFSLWFFAVLQFNFVSNFVQLRSAALSQRRTIAEFITSTLQSYSCQFCSERSSKLDKSIICYLNSYRHNSNPSPNSNFTGICQGNFTRRTGTSREVVRYIDVNSDISNQTNSPSNVEMKLTRINVLRDKNITSIFKASATTTAIISRWKQEFAQS